MSNSGTCNFTIHDIRLGDLPGNRHNTVLAEVRGMLGIFEGSGKELGLAQNVELDVVLTGDMRYQVNRIQACYGNASDVPYNPILNTVAAQGITLTSPDQPPLHATIVLNHESWTKDDSQSVAIRAYLLIHEVIHVIQQACLINAEQKQSAQQTATNEEQVRSQARILWNEYDADIVADQICRKFILRTDDGKPIGAGDFLVNRFVGSAAELLERMCKFVEEEVQAYRLRQAPLDTLYPTAFGLLRELLRVLAHASALWVGKEAMEVLTKALKSLRGFNEFIAEDWQAFLSALSGKPVQASESELVRIWNVIMGRLGLEIEDLPDDRLYVHVSEPVFCCDPKADDVDITSDKSEKQVVRTAVQQSEQLQDKPLDWTFLEPDR